MRTYNGMSGTVGVHKVCIRFAGAKHLLAEAMAITGNTGKYKIINVIKEEYPNLRIAFAHITYEVFA